MNQCSLNVNPIFKTNRFSDSMSLTEGVAGMYCPVMLNTLFRWYSFKGKPNPTLTPYSLGPSIIFCDTRIWRLEFA